jgi:integrase/recombinase XerD
MFHRPHRPTWQRLDYDARPADGVPTPSATPVAGAQAFDDFVLALRDERGFAPDTIVNHERTLRPFLAWIATRPRPWHDTTAEDVTTYLASHPQWSRATIAQHVHHLRSFFRHAAAQGWCRMSLALQIDAPRLYTHERLPQGPTRTQVQQLVEAHRGDTPRLLRDRAMLLLFAVYGFRSAEVRRLTFDDIDWEHEIIRPPRPKQRKVGHYPLVREVGDAIVAYVTRARPRCACRHIFVRLRPPYQPLTGGALSVLVGVAQKRLGQQLRHYGPHSLRHASATYLLAEGFSLKEIGDHLGHTSLRATEIYAKVDLTTLRLVGDVDLTTLVAHEASCAARETPFYAIGQLAALRTVAAVSLGGVQ